jgi:hypothetical protein
MNEKKVHLFSYNYSAGGAYKCFLTDSVEKVLQKFPEFTLVDWKDFKLSANNLSLSADIKAQLIRDAFDIDGDPASDPMLKHLNKTRENERLYQEKKRQGLI